MAQDFTFLNHTRFGLSTAVVATDGPRAILNLRLEVAGDGVARSVDLPAISVYGPGDVLGFEARAIMRTEPVGGAVDFDCTALAAIDFSDEDFPWRYSPLREAKIDGVGGGRLTPWLTLLVLSADEYDPIKQNVLQVTAAHAVPDLAQGWAWAHVQVNKPIGVDGVIETGRRELRDALAANPGIAFSRLMCPRRLSAQTAYRGFVVPSFEAGRLAGLGLAIDGIAATQLAFAPQAVPPPMPILYQFAFSTGEEGDFESLVTRLLSWVARPEDNLGRRLMDMTTWPGDPQAGTLDETPALWLEGALRVPGADAVREPLPDGSTETGRWRGDDRANFTAALKPLLQAGLGRPPAVPPIADPDPDAEPDDSLLPLIAPPVYGAGHAAIRSLEAGPGGALPPPWITDLNLDPAYRVGAGFGTRDVQHRQEDYMARAWAQYGDLFSINRRIALGQFWRTISQEMFARALPRATQPTEQVRILGIARPARAVVTVNGANLKAALTASALKPALTGGAFARIARPNGPLAKRAVAAAGLSLSQAAGARATLALNAAAAVATRDLVIAPSILRPSGRIVLGTAAAPVAIVMAAEIAEARPQLVRGFRAAEIAALSGQADVIRQASAGLKNHPVAGGQAFRLGVPATRARASVGKMASRSLAQFGSRTVVTRKRFVAPAFDSMLAPQRLSGQAIANAGIDAATVQRGSDFAKRVGAVANDRASWGRLQDAVARVQDRIDLDLGFSVTPSPRADLAELAETTRRALEPGVALTARLRAVLDLGPLIFPERLDPVMPAPVFNDAMQTALAPLGKGKEDRLLPNIAVIPNNSVTLLENNQAFIESYMAGLNHELARELLWREYPTDGRGSYFRRFWNTDACPDLTDDERDSIKPVHGWKKHLGKHPANPKADGAAVVTIRGDLLRRYPNTDIFAVRSWWIPAGNPQSSAAVAEHFPSAPLDKWTRVPDPREWNRPDLTAPGAEPDFVRHPIFRGVAADCTFIGLPLTADEMHGDGVPGSPNPGWYVVLREKVGEPRFGADDQFLDSKGVQIGAEPLKSKLDSWNQLDWEHYGLSAGSLSRNSDRWRMLDLARAGQPSVGGRTLGTSHAGEVAASLLQKPVQVYIHASQLLPKRPGE